MTKCKLCNSKILEKCVFAKHQKVKNEIEDNFCCHIHSDNPKKNQKFNFSNKESI